MPHYANVAKVFAAYAYAAAILAIGYWLIVPLGQVPWPFHRILAQFVCVCVCVGVVKSRILAQFTLFI